MPFFIKPEVIHKRAFITLPTFLSNEMIYSDVIAGDIKYLWA